MTTRLVIIGGGPAGNTCATVAATLGADVTLIERDIVGGAAHLWDCIPSKALIATGGELSELRRARLMGIQASGELDIDALRERVQSIEDRLHTSIRDLLVSQGVRLIAGTARFAGPHEVVVDTGERASRRSRPTSCSWPPARGRGSPTGPRSTASVCSPPARPTRRPRSRGTSW